MTGNIHSLKILMVAARYSPYIGGVETHVYEVAWRLAEAGIRVTVLTTDVSGQLPAKEEANGVQILRVRAWPSNTDLHIAPALSRIVAQGTWDLVHCQGYHTFVPPVAMYAAQRVRLPYVLTFHSGGDTSLFRRAIRGTQRRALRPLLKNAQKLIGPSNWEVEYFSARLDLPRSLFTVIPNGAQHLPKVTDTTKCTKDGKLIVSVGRLEKYKGHQRVISALPKVLEHFPDARLRIIGKGSYEAALQKLARDLGVTERVEIAAVPPGDANSMASIMGQADLVTLLSEHEAQGIAVLEALDLGRPVLVAGTTALQEFADQGLARAVPLRSTPEDVAMAIVKQLRNPLVPVNVQLPTWDACADSLLRLYQSTIERSTCAS